MVDAWWRDAGVAAEVDSRAYHTSVAEQEQDARRHDRLIANGVLLLHFSPRRIKADGRGVVTDVASAVVQGRGRPRLAIVAIPADASWEDFVARQRAVG
jgi:very-short-patch-repair endonuclease